MPYKPDGTWDYEDESISGRLTGIVSRHSPVMQQAQTTGLKMANRRGLINSSMAVGAAQNEMLKTAVPMASQEAAQVAQKNVTAQNLTGQKQLQESQIGSQEKIAFANVAAHDRQFATTAAADMQKTYGGVFTEILKNNDIPAAARNQYYTHAKSLMDQNLMLLESLYGIDLDWAVAAPQV